MTRGRGLYDALKAAGHGVDLVGGGSGSMGVFCTCRITQAEVRELLKNKGWHPTGMDHFDPPGTLRFYLPPLRVRK